MKKILLASIFFYVFFTAGIQAQDAQQDFTVVNATGFVIDQLFISPAESDEWDEDVLGEEVLSDEEECDIIFSPKEDNCVWDLKIIDEEGDEVEWEKIDLCKALKVTLYWKDGKAWADIVEVDQ